MDYGSISDEEKEKMKEKFNEGDGSTLVGASDEDYEYLGLRKPDSGISLHEEAKKKGGSLSMQDLMKAMDAREGGEVDGESKTEVTDLMSRLMSGDTLSTDELMSLQRN